MSAPLLCVLCRRRPAEPVWHPFCSERCKLQDLARWLDGAYRVAGEGVRSDGHALDPDGGSEDSD